MKLWIKRSLIGIASIGLLASLTACGSHRHHHGDWSAEQVTQMRGKVIEKASRKLDLNEAQKQKLGVLADTMLTSRTAMQGTDAQPRQQLKGLIAGSSFDRAAAQALLSSKTQEVQGQGPKVIAALGDFFDSLNPAQQQQLRELLEKRGGRWARG
jgi:periplasmic protein CpxP/Spy